MSTCGLEQQRLNRLVGFEQRSVRMASQLLPQIVQLTIGQPGLARIGSIDRAHCLAEHFRQHPLPKAVAQTGRRVLRHARPLVDHRPALLGELAQEGLFDFGVFRHV